MTEPRQDALPVSDRARKAAANAIDCLPYERAMSFAKIDRVLTAAFAQFEHDLRPPAAPAPDMREAAQAILDRASDTYTARNGRKVGIQADDGEKCWIVHSDDIEDLRRAIAALQLPDAKPTFRDGMGMCPPPRGVASYWPDDDGVMQPTNEAAIRALATEGQARACPHGSTGPCSVCGDQG